MDELPDSIAVILLHGAVLAGRARRAVGRSTYAKLLANGVLVRRPGRVVVYPPLADAWTPIVVVQLRCPTAVASHRLALWIHQISPERGIRSPRYLEFVATRRSRILGVMETSYLPSSDVMVIGGVRVTTPARTLADLAMTAGEDALEVAGEAMLHARVVKEIELHGAVLALRARGRSGVPALRRFLDRRRDGTPACESDIEVRFLQLVRRLGYPEPTWRQLRVPRRGRQPYRVDFAWDLGDYWLLVEIDGAFTHANPLALGSDLRRQNFIGRTRPGLLRFTPDQIDLFPESVDDDMGAHVRRKRQGRPQPADLAAAS